MSIPLSQSGGSGGSSLATPVSLANGGTHADLSAQGGATFVLKQSGVGADITSAAILAAELPNHSAALITSGSLALARGGTNADLSASGSATAFLAQDASHVVTARAMVAGDFPLLDVSGITGFFGGFGPVTMQLAGANAALANVNKMQGLIFYVPHAINIRKVVCRVNAVSVSASQFASFGLCDSSGNRVLDSGTFDVSAGQATGVKSNTITVVQINPGFYYFVWTSNNATDATFAVTTAMNSPQNIQTQNGNTVVTGQATTAGALASTIGAFTKVTVTPPVVWFCS